MTPEAPSLAEAGVKDIDVDIWFALFGPPGLPREVVTLLNGELGAIMRAPETRASLLDRKSTRLNSSHRT